MIREALEYMIDNAKIVYLDLDYEKLTTKKEPGTIEVKVSLEIYNALILVETEYEKLANKKS